MEVISIRVDHDRTDLKQPNDDKDGRKKSRRTSSHSISIISRLERKSTPEYVYFLSKIA